MLVIDDYKELVALENLLRRLGFDVLSLGKDILVPDALVRFHPEIVIATAKGRAVDGLKVAARVKKQAPSPRVALAYTAGTAPNLTEENKRVVDGLIAVPIQPASAIKLIAQLTGLEVAPLLEKFQKFTLGRSSEPSSVRVSNDFEPKPVNESVSVSGDAWDPTKTPGRAAQMRTGRSDRYDAYLNAKDEPIEHQVVPREKAQSAMRELKRAADKEKDLIDQINQEKLAFAKAMFDFKNGKPKP